MSAAWPSAPPGVSTTTGAPAARITATISSGSILPEPRLSCRSRPESNASLRVVGVDQVDAAGDRLDPVDDAEQVLAAGVGVAGVEAEADVVLADRVPQPGQRVEPAGAGVVAAGGVLDQDRGGEAAVVLPRTRRSCASCRSRSSSSSPVSTCPPWTIRPLAPTSAAACGVAEQQLAARDADAVVERRDVDQVGRVDVDVDVRRRAAPRRRPRLGRLVALRVGEEELHRRRPRGRRPAASGSVGSTWAPMRMQASLRRAAPTVARTSRPDPANRPDGPRHRVRSRRRYVR